MCIGAKTKISTIDKNGKLKLIAAEDLNVGDNLVCPIWDEFDCDDYLDYEHEKVFYNQLTNLSKRVAPVKNISSKVVTDTVIFNSDPNKHFSTKQPILAKKQGTETFAWEITGTITAGDTVMQYSSLKEEFEELLIKNVQILDNIEETVYMITPAEDMTFVAGDIIAC
jgi:intein/homing endonuclease